LRALIIAEAFFGGIADKVRDIHVRSSLYAVVGGDNLVSGIGGAGAHCSASPTRASSSFRRDATHLFPTLRPGNILFSSRLNACLGDLPMALPIAAAPQSKSGTSFSESFTAALRVGGR
jgi:hypothetical protein